MRRGIAQWRARLTTMAVAGNVVLAVLASPAALVTTEKDTSRDFNAKMKQWRTEMSEKFRDAYRSLRGGKEKPSATASIDLREQDESYTVRLDLPGRDLAKVEVRLEGDTLRIAAPAEEKSGAYEQNIQLGDVEPDATLQIERKLQDNLIVITVPKMRGQAQTNRSASIPDPAIVPLEDWDHDVLARMEKMRREMDRVFAESFKELSRMPGHESFFDEERFGSTIDLAEEDDNYIVRAYLPARDMKNVNVTLDGRVLKIEAKAEEEKKGEKTVVGHQARYSQMLTLPGPVENEKMKVDRKENMLVVMLPKIRSD